MEKSQDEAQTLRYQLPKDQLFRHIFNRSEAKEKDTAEFHKMYF